MGVQAYCPSTKSCAYVVLHDAASRIFAIAFNMRSIALRLAGAAKAEALADGGEPIPAIGPDWVHFNPWGQPRATRDESRLLRWATRAYADGLV